MLEYEEKINKGEYPKNHRRYKIGDFKLKENFIKDIQSDLALFDSIIKELAKMDLVKDDPKAECLLANIKDVLKQKPQQRRAKKKGHCFFRISGYCQSFRENFNKTLRREDVSGGRRFVRAHYCSY